MQSAWQQLTAILPPDQQEQLAVLLIGKLQAGWGAVTIEVQDHHVKLFRSTSTHPARRPRRVTVDLDQGEALLLLSELPAEPGEVEPNQSELLRLLSEVPAKKTITRT